MSAPESALPPPNGCQHCGVSAQDHCQLWHPDASWHGWVEPTNEQRLSRMYARRAARLGLPTWSRPAAKDGAYLAREGVDLSGCGLASSLPTERSEP